MRKPRHRGKIRNRFKLREIEWEQTRINQGPEKTALISLEEKIAEIDREFDRQIELKLNDPNS
jgi:hypothetical protein